MIDYKEQPRLNSAATTAIKNADNLINEMYRARSSTEAHSYVNSSTRIIDSLANLGVPEDEITRLTDKHWHTWLIIYSRLEQR